MEHSKRIEDLELIQKVFDSCGVRVILVYGALLGFYRDKTFLPDDDDIDLCVIDDIDLKTRKKIGWMLYDLGFISQEIVFNVFFRMEQQDEGYGGDGETGIIVCKRNFKFTIFFFKEVSCETHGEEYVCIPKLGALKLISTPKQYFEKLGKIKIHKKEYLTPSPIEDYLAFTYFDNWKDKTDRRHGLTYFKMHPNEETELIRRYEEHQNANTRMS